MTRTRPLEACRLNLTPAPQARRAEAEQRAAHRREKAAVVTALKAADMYDPAPSHTPTPAQLSRIATRQQEADARALKRRPSLTRRGSIGDPAHIPAKPKLTAAQIASIAARRQQVSTPRLGPVHRPTGPLIHRPTNQPAHRPTVCAPPILCKLKNIHGHHPHPPRRPRSALG